ncbi:chromosome segregation protein SMC [Indioceanicola profundi]|uniref:chromosome segregation protein SMC n=1 Tax=Indioceanicola profundi TaxID=2220096 RepID=UPI000E6ADE91|nr:chromosome segregation protein SMC [Indioceanicola profundi]
MQFTKLRLSGFKSFVDATELLIEPGMTGVVGPNGCGKSNLLEALRWVMGETSAKRMRGADMDDVIFGGTATRPARNVCEVGLVLDNSSRTAPAGLNEADVLEITRRLERSEGSDYRINGKHVRARDVQILFADNASGANSPALVSQGRVGALINARPGDRRQLLEEAAGISGLHARRHEAELRLRAAEANLTRLDDVLGAMDTQLQGLRKQARQASRYRNLQEHIRRAEAILLHLRWSQSEDQLARARAGFEQAENAVRNLMLAVTQNTTKRTMAAADIQPKRQAEAAAAAALQRLVLAREQLDAEERRAKEGYAALQRRLAQIDGDLAREKSLAMDARGAIERLAEERQFLTEATSEEEMLREEAQGALLEAKDLVESIDRELARAMDAIAAEEAKRGALDRQVRELEARAATLHRRIEEQEGQRDALKRQMEGAGALSEAEEAIATAEERLEMARAEAEEAEAAKGAADRQLEEVRAKGQAAQTRARETLTQLDTAYAKLKAEADALRSVLKAGTPGNHAPAIDSLTVAPGYEAALAAALGDDLAAALEESAPIHWRSMPALPDPAPLPAGAEPLAAHVKAPAHLARCLAHVGVVEDGVAGDRAALALKPGQIVVTRFGGAWRWDGLTVRAGAPTAAAERLKQRNRLTELEAGLDEAEERALTAKAALEDAREEAESTLTAARQAVDQAANRDRAARDAVRAAFAAASKARDAHAKLAQASAAAASRLQALTEAVEALAEDRAEAEAEWAEARAQLEELPDPAEGRNRIAEFRARLAEARSAQSERQNAMDRLVREAESRQRRLAAIAQEEASWTGRLAGTDGRLRELEERAAEGRAELETLAERPAEIELERAALLDRIAEAERTRKRAADELVQLEGHLNEVERALREAESRLADAREARAHAEAAVGAARQLQDSLRERIAERLECEPEKILAVAEIEPGEQMPEPAAVETRLERLTAERENMGPVNLRAEVEVAELEAQIGTMTAEREDLIAAIARLRQGISSLNREARERLLASFTKVDGHFQEMFTKLFGGGKAHLKLTEAEDPLDAGLEIYASPPGKKLQVLSLLSGGEQALTALALIFAVFICNPAPICVLDEVDAPLDEANVGRFCDLVEEMARGGYTRFLIVTHHRLTMARMDRLFGVTMAERGISQLVSVDLAMAEELRGAA